MFGYKYTIGPSGLDTQLRSASSAASQHEHPRPWTPANNEHWPRSDRASWRGQSVKLSVAVDLPVEGMEIGILHGSRGGARAAGTSPLASWLLCGVWKAAQGQ